MSDESRFDSDADRESLDEQTVTEHEPPPGANPVDETAVEEATEGDEDEDKNEVPQQARERRRGGGDPVEPADEEP